MFSKFARDNVSGIAKSEVNAVGTTFLAVIYDSIPSKKYFNLSAAFNLFPPIFW